VTASEQGDGEAEHAIYAADAILDYPQCGEHFQGRSKIQAQCGAHPAERHFTVRRILGGGDLWPFPAPSSRPALAEQMPGRDR
jgi:hypothetical protein